MKKLQELELENIALRNKIQILEEICRATKSEEIDTLSVSSHQEERGFTLQHADDLYHFFLQEMNEGTVTLDIHGKIIYCNPNLALILKKPIEKVLGSNFEDYIVPSQKQRFRELCQQAKQDVFRGELDLITETHNQIPVNLSVKLFQINEITFTCIVINDLTSQKRNKEIIAAERLTNSILEQAVEAIIVYDTTGQIIRANQAAQQLCGKNPLLQRFDEVFPLQFSYCSCFQEIAKSLLIDRKPAEQQENSQIVSLSGLLQGQILQGVEVSLNCQDRREINLLLSASPLLSSEKQILGSVVTLTNITERKQMEEQMAALVIREKAAYNEAEVAQKRLSNILETISDAFVAVDCHWRYTYINQKAAKILGREPQDLIGKNIWQEYPLEFCERVYHSYHKALKEQVFIHLEEYYPSCQRWVDHRIYPSLEGVSIFWQDITKQKQVEIALRESEEQLRLALEAAQMGTWDWNVLTNHTTWSTKHEQLFGLTPGTFVGNSEAFTNCVYPEDREGVIKALISAQQTKSDYHQEYRVIWPDGSIHWLASKGKFFYDDQNRAVRMLGTTVDISDRKQREQQLHLLESVIVNINDAVMITEVEPIDEPGPRIVYVNPAFTRMTGYSLEEVLGKTPRILQGSKSDHHTLEQIRAALEACQSVKVDVLNYRKDGSNFWAELSIVPVANQKDCFSHWVAVQRDINERKQAEADLQQAKAQLEMKVTERTVELSQANNHLHRLINILTATINQQTKIEAQLREAERRWRSLLENVRLLVIGLDKDGKVEYVNPFFLELGGYTQEEVLGKYWFTTFIPQRQQHYMHKIFGELINQELHIHHKNQVITKFGEERTIAWNNTLLRDAQGQIIGTMSIGEDITQRQALEKIKDEFISVVSHELRTPMTSIQGGLNLLATGLVKLDSEKGKRIIEIASESTERLVRLVNDILDLERLQSGKINLIKQKINTDELLRESTELMQLTANQSDVNLSVVSQSIEVTVDKDRIIQVLTNLFSNAIKFSPKGSTVFITVEKTQAKDGRAVVLFKIQDQGRGIPADKIETIFERFHQVDASDSRRQGGTGLGLAIAHNIVQQHDGQIWVESQIGSGSTFYLMLPIC